MFKKYTFLILTGIFFLGESGKVMAECNWINQANTATYTYTPPIHLVSPSQFSYNVDTNTITGAMLAALSGVSSVSAYIIQCSSGSDTISIRGGDFSLGALTGAALSNYIRPNADVQLGMYFRSTKTSGYWQYPDPHSGGSTTYTVDEIYKMNGLSFSERSGLISWKDIIISGGYNINIYMVKSTYSVGSGTLPSGLLGTITAGSLELLNINFARTDIISSSCEVSDAPPQVPLGTSYPQRFNSPGDTQNETKFSITISCNHDAVSPTIMFDGNTSSTYPTVFVNTSGDGYAENVGVQLLKNSSVITPKTNISLGKAMSTAPTVYDFNARLYRLSGNVTLGAVDVPVTFTISYE